MGETLLVLTLVTLIVLTIRRAKPVILDNPVIIQRPGQYHITLAPQLNRAQLFIEQIAQHFSQLHLPERDLPTQYFEVRDPSVFSKGENCYLLAIALREFSEAVLKQHPLSEPSKELGGEKLRAVVNTIAGQLKIAVTVLQATD